MAEDWNQIAAASKPWKWLPGMLDTYGRRVLRLDAEGRRICVNGTRHEDGIPDLNDDGTRGAILFGILVPAGWRVDDLSYQEAYLSHPDVDECCDGPIPEAFARALQATPVSS